MFLIVIITNFYSFQSDQVETTPDDTPTSYDDEIDLVDLFSDDDPVADCSQLTEEQCEARDQ